jgi:hypothetical protein
MRKKSKCIQISFKYVVTLLPFSSKLRYSSLKIKPEANRSCPFLKLTLSSGLIVLSWSLHCLLGWLSFPEAYIVFWVEVNMCEVFVIICLFLFVTGGELIKYSKRNHTKRFNPSTLCLCSKSLSRISSASAVLIYAYIDWLNFVV